MPTSWPPLNRLFVYGTLMPGRLRWPVLEPYATAHRTAAVPGRLYDSGRGWPVACFANAGPLVPGVLVELSPARVDQVLPVLDDIEGTVAGTYRRIVVRTGDGATAWAYDFAQAVDGLRQIDRWSGFDER